MFNKTQESAIKIVYALKNAAKPVGSVALALVGGTTTHHTEQLMSKLKRFGVVKSVRGPGGGYMLTQDDISVMTIVRAVSRRDIKPVTDPVLVSALTQYVKETSNVYGTNGTSINN